MLKNDVSISGGSKAHYRGLYIKVSELFLGALRRQIYWLIQTKNREIYKVTKKCL